MNWKYEAIEKLKEYSAKKQSLKSIPEEMARLESAMQSIRSATADGTPVSGGGSGREDMMLSFASAHKCGLHRQYCTKNAISFFADCAVSR